METRPDVIVAVLSETLDPAATLNKAARVVDLRPKEGGREGRAPERCMVFLIAHSLRGDLTRG